MAKIVCEMCGSSNILNKEEYFVCQSCGTKYSKAEFQSLVNETTAVSNDNSKTEMIEKITDGMYKVGKDIPSGEYKFTAENPSSMGYSYWDKRSDPSDMKTILGQGVIQPGSSSYITVSNGEYLYIRGGEVYLVNKGGKIEDYAIDNSKSDINSSNIDSKSDINSSNIDSKNLNQKNGCYIATSIYDSYDCPEVWTLRRFRDQKLSKTILGKTFIKLYYSISPTIVEYFGKNKYFNNLFKLILDNFISYLHKNGIKSTYYVDKLE
ncbi:MAG: hypothetical protein FWH54_01500 [Methanobrevibacter sp.]|nr:hypothetical protein [Methanobrevibacter sp.]